jgi:hypothetical protein
MFMLVYLIYWWISNFDRNNSNVSDNGLSSSLALELKDFYFDQLVAFEKLAIC